jgi:hypothetical protein
MRVSLTTGDFFCRAGSFGSDGEQLVEQHRRALGISEQLVFCLVIA